MISKEYISLLSALLTKGYSKVAVYSYSYSYSNYSSVSYITFNFPTGIMMVAKEGGIVQATSLASIQSLIESGGELSITYLATFTTSFSANEIDMYAVIGTTMLYKIASVTGSFTSSSDDNLSVEWTIDVVVGNIFNVSSGSSGVTAYSLPTGQCTSLSGQLIMYPYLVHLLIAYTLIPSTSFTVQSKYPNLPLATMLATVPTPTSPTQLQGITSFMYACGNTPVLCYPVYNDVGTAIITSSVNCTSLTIVALYQIGSTYLAYMQSPANVTLNVGNAYSYEFGVVIS
ncbi:hypothetical protein [Deltalipothrixvirus pozzuoliense]|uniref:Uncharacterized protein ORF286a n=1 Tax=Acidianus filamentous virus 2 (isolate Italy/Pozzuoli) TaxID=654910 RepID=Y286A_AFV2P|nr:hypothetical protein AFV2_gp43 [Acidianus filamentous virus 2]Q573C6.1 RecName: Full=Uncharacterized protein ORF286a; Flags: Precursor [Acidianus filamentous virus 2 (isolate Pozzuoli)]CAH69430.1 hypothetical protein [Acidianus filamentous virus 2]